MAAYEHTFSVSTAGLSIAKDLQKPSLLAVASEAALLRARTLHQAFTSSKSTDTRKDLEKVADQMLQLVKQNGSNYSALRATAEILGWAKQAGKELPLSMLQVSLSWTSGITYVRHFQ